MGGRRRLKGGAARMLGHHDGLDGRAFRRYYDAVAVEVGAEVLAERPLLRLEVSRMAALGVQLEAATRALTAGRRERERGKGRRPSAQAIERLARRQGLADQSYSQALGQLLERAARDGRTRPSTLAGYIATRYGATAGDHNGPPRPPARPGAAAVPGEREERSPADPARPGASPATTGGGGWRSS